MQQLRFRVNGRTKNGRIGRIRRKLEEDGLAENPEIMGKFEAS